MTFQLADYVAAVLPRWVAGEDEGLSTMATALHHELRRGVCTYDSCGELDTPESNVEHILEKHTSAAECAQVIAVLAGWTDSTMEQALHDGRVCSLVHRLFDGDTGDGILVFSVSDPATGEVTYYMADGEYSSFSGADFDGVELERVAPRPVVTYRWPKVRR